MAARLKELYNTTILPELKEKIGRAKRIRMLLPKLEKGYHQHGRRISYVQDKKEIGRTLTKRWV